MKTLPELFAEFPYPFSGQLAPTPIADIAIDNRKIQPGGLFVALKGGSADGHNFIPDAIRRGAAAIVGQREIDGLPVPYIRVENTRHALTHLAAAFYGYPGRRLIVIGITGTDGKTTTSNLLYHILLAAGIKTGMISTVNAVIGDTVLDTGFHVTTPDAHDVQNYLAQMVAAGLTHVILETTSHGLAQHRTDAALYDIAVVTNVTHEHMDEHGDYEHYLASKGRLFELIASTPPKDPRIPPLGVLNLDDQKSYPYLRAITKTAQTSYGLTSQPDIHAENIHYTPRGLTFDILGPNFRVDSVHSSLVGAYNVSNCLAAFSAAVVGLGIDPQIAAHGLAALPGVPGRMERINLGQPFTAIVDFAHTPNALKVTLETARQMLASIPAGDGPGVKQTFSPPPMGEGPGVREIARVIVVFGSAGLRDRAKRRMMAETAAELADISILTAEDPRTESLDSILQEMADGAVSRGGIEGETFHRVRDRGEAIKLALRLARPGDIVLSCGKGHEQSMCFGTTEYLWDDRIAMRAALAQFLGVDGPKMPYLPTQES